MSTGFLHRLLEHLRAATPLVDFYTGSPESPSSTSVPAARDSALVTFGRLAGELADLDADVRADLAEPRLDTYWQLVDILAAVTARSRALFGPYSEEATNHGEVAARVYEVLEHDALAEACDRLQGFPEHMLSTEEREAIRQNSTALLIDARIAAIAAAQDGYAATDLLEIARLDLFDAATNRERRFELLTHEHERAVSTLRWVTYAHARVYDADATEVRLADALRGVIESELTRPVATPVVHAPTAGSLVAVVRQPTVLDALDDLIGLDAVKHELRQFADAVRGQARLASAGIATDPIHAGHYAFVGEPGTGKTTVARLLGAFSQEYNLLPSDKVVEVDRGGLVAEYVGQTAPKTLERLEAARGGILFVDEAYALVGGSRNDFGREALATIVKYMSDHEGELSVVFAGYEREIEQLLDANPGLRSRTTTFRFEALRHDQATELFNHLATEHGWDISAEAALHVDGYLMSARFNSGWGNARTVKALVDEIARNHQARVGRDTSLTDEALMTIVAADIPAAPSLRAEPQAEPPSLGL